MEVSRIMFVLLILSVATFRLADGAPGDFLLGIIGAGVVAYLPSPSVVVVSTRPKKEAEQ